MDRRASYPVLSRLNLILAATWLLVGGCSEDDNSASESGGTPPDPSIAGIDEDKDGVRDDVQALIDQLGQGNAAFSDDLKTVARLEQTAIVVPQWKPHDAVLLAKQLNYLRDCLGQKYGAEIIAQSQRTVESQLIDTMGRLRARLRFDSALGMGVFPSVTIPSGALCTLEEAAASTTIGYRSAVNEPAVFYINGLTTPDGKAEENRKAVEEHSQLWHFFRTELKRRNKSLEVGDADIPVGLIYNPTAGGFEDLIEAGIQAGGDEHTVFTLVKLLYLGSEATLDSLSHALEQATNGACHGSSIFIEDCLRTSQAMQDAYEEKLKDPNLWEKVLSRYQEHFAVMLKDIRAHTVAGRNVILIAHSQGNFFANGIFDSLPLHERKHLRIVAIATPDRRIAGVQDPMGIARTDDRFRWESHYYTTHHLDGVVFAVGEAGLEPLAPNVFQEVTEASSHALVGTYLFPSMPTTVHIAFNLARAWDTCPPCDFQESMERWSCSPDGASLVRTSKSRECNEYYACGVKNTLHPCPVGTTCQYPNGEAACAPEPDICEYGRVDTDCPSEDTGEATTSGDEGTTGDMSETITEDTGSEDVTGEGEDTSDDTGEDPCAKVECLNGGECNADTGTCDCPNNFDPANHCRECKGGFVEREGTCVTDRCAANPCRIGGNGHGESCKVNSDGTDHVCTCLGDYTPDSDCLSCPPGKNPGPGHTCIDPVGPCENVTCGTGASCVEGDCECDDPDAFEDGSGNCKNPCKANPCNVGGNGHGQSCTPTSATGYECTCKGGFDPDSDCESCPDGEHDDDGTCVPDCANPCSGNVMSCSEDQKSEIRCVDGCLEVVAHCGDNASCRDADDRCKCDEPGHVMDDQGDCSAADPCDGVSCGTGASCTGTGECECTDPSDVMNDQGDCRPPDSCPFADGECEGVPAGMVCVPAGVFTMGTLENENEQPVREICLSTFYIDLTEVTVDAFAECVADGACSTDGFSKFSACNWNHQGSRGGHPIDCTDWKHADDYCRWAGKRLPTEAEWEKAAGGTDNRTYPWGEETPTCERVITKDDSAGGRACGRHGTWPVRSKSPQGDSPYGISDMAGNVAEWVNDLYSEVYEPNELTNPTGPASGDLRVVRGGGWYRWYEKAMRVSGRFGRAPAARDGSEYGFRCAADTR